MTFLFHGATTAFDVYMPTAALKQRATLPKKRSKAEEVHASSQKITLTTNSQILQTAKQLGEQSVHESGQNWMDFPGL